MYTILENARIVIALLKEHNINHIVISPGGSNIPIVQGIQQDPFFKCYSVVDERSAMYFAIGLYLELGVPIATSCTSAQATRNYVPGLTEAFYKKVPILAITMSKHPKYLGQEYMQCPIQTSLPIDAVKKSYSLPYISNEHDREQCIRTTNEAILELTHHKLGPVQLNIEELDSETWCFDTSATLPDVRCIKRICSKDKFDCDLTNKRIMLLIGEHRPFDPKTKEAIENFCQKYDVLVYSDHISNYSGKYALNCNLISAGASKNFFKTNLLPDILITIGGVTGDYFVYGHLVNAPKGSFEHWRIDIDGDVIDTYGKLTKIFQMDFCDFNNLFEKAVESNEHIYYYTFRTLLDNCKYNVELPFSNIYAAQQLHSLIPSNSSMHFAILNSLRVWSFFPLNENIECYSNVAAFGIDGCLSTLIGESVARPDKQMFHITGDLSFFYDMNSLGIRHIGNNIHILLVNNNGGVEFKLGDLEDRTDVSNYIAADNHFRNARGWAETNGFIYLCAHNKEEFNKQLGEFVAASSKPILLEVFTTPENERLANQTFISTNDIKLSSEDLKKQIKESIKKIIGLKNFKLIKSVIKK